MKGKGRLGSGQGTQESLTCHIVLRNRQVSAHMGFRRRGAPVQRADFQDGGTNTHVLLPHPPTERTEGIHNKKRCTTGLKTKDPREKTQPGTRMGVGG